MQDIVLGLNVNEYVSMNIHVVVEWRRILGLAQINPLFQTLLMPKLTVGVPTEGVS